MQEESYLFTEGSSFNGILSHLRSECGGNVHEKGVVNITASSDGYEKCHYVTDHGWGGCWLTRQEPNAWICFDFKEKSVRLTGYTLGTYSDGPGGDHLIHWVIEGSNDGSEWRELDRRDTKDLNGADRVKTYSCGQGISDSFRFVRLRQTGKNAGGNDELDLRGVELFGTLRRSLRNS